MSDIAKLIDAVIKAQLAPALRSVGFKQRRRNFRRRVEDAVQVINIQPSRWNLGSEGEFTVNLGLYFPAAASFIGRYEEVEEPTTERDCPLLSRIGTLMPDRKDAWWFVGPRTDVDALGRAVAEAMIQYGVPWLDHGSVLRAAADGDYPQSGPIVKAVLLLAVGDRAAATELMAQSLQQGDGAPGGWFAFASAARLESEYRAARAMKR